MIVLEAQVKQEKKLAQDGIIQVLQFSAMRIMKMKCKTNNERIASNNITYQPLIKNIYAQELDAEHGELLITSLLTFSTNCDM